jgi:hypothetical protein
MPELDVREKDLKNEAMRMATLIFSDEVGLMQDIKDRVDIEVLYHSLYKIFRKYVPFTPDNPAIQPMNKKRKEYASHE